MHDSRAYTAKARPLWSRPKHHSRTLKTEAETNLKTHKKPTEIPKFQLQNLIKTPHPTPKKSLETTTKHAENLLKNLGKTSKNPRTKDKNNLAKS